MTAEEKAAPKATAPSATPASADAGGETKLATPPKGFTILPTPEGKKDGLITCPKCGASEVAFNQAKGLLFCAFCRNQWAPESLDAVMGLSEGIGTLTGTIVTTAAVDITSSETLVTFKCSGCGAEVVVDTEHNLQARCHWCKHTLQLNNKIDNGAVPDGILPFTVTKQQAMASISAFAGDRKTFQHPDFKASFRPENIMGVYMPYMTVDSSR
jgi:DNA-directed RNA polymerase subunit RPC12/RpoP